MSLPNSSSASYATGNVAEGASRGDSNSSSVAAGGGISNIRSRLELAKRFNYSLPQSDAGTVIDRVTGTWAAPPGATYGNAPGAAGAIDITMDFAGKAIDMSSHTLSFVLRTFRVPGASPLDPNPANKQLSHRRYNAFLDAHNNNASILMRLAAFHRLISRYRITTAGGQPLEEAEQVDLACEIRHRFGAAEPPPKVVWTFCPAPASNHTAIPALEGGSTAVVAPSATIPLGAWHEDLNMGLGSGETMGDVAFARGVARPHTATTVVSLYSSLHAAGADYLAHFNAPSCISNPSGCAPIQNALYPTAIGSAGGRLVGVQSANTTLGHGPVIYTASSALGGAGFRNNFQYDAMTGNDPVGPSLNFTMPRDPVPFVGRWRAIVVQGFGEESYSGVNWVDDYDLQLSFATNCETLTANTVPFDGDRYGRRVTVQLPCQIFRGPVIPDIKMLRIELTLNDVNIAFQGLGSETTNESRPPPQNEMTPFVARPADWQYEMSNLVIRADVLTLANTLRASMQKALAEGGVPFHYTQWSPAGDVVGTSTTFTHAFHRNVANVVAAVSVFRSPKAYVDGAYDSYSFLRPNITSAQYTLGTSLFPPTPLTTGDDFYRSLREVFPLPNGAQGGIPRVDRDGQSRLGLEGAFFSYYWPGSHNNTSGSAAPVPTGVRGAGGRVSTHYNIPIIANNGVLTFETDTDAAKLFGSRMSYDQWTGGVNSVASATTYAYGDAANTPEGGPLARRSNAGSSVNPNVSYSLGQAVSHGYRGIVYRRIPKSWCIARSFLSVPGITLTGLSTLQGQQLRLTFTRASGTVDLRQIYLDFDPQARQAFIVPQVRGGSAPGMTSAGVSSLDNLNRSLYVPYTALWEVRDFTAEAADFTMPNSGFLVRTPAYPAAVPSAGSSVRAMIANFRANNLMTNAHFGASGSASQLVVAGFVDLSNVQGYLNGLDSNGMLDFARALQMRASIVTGVAPTGDPATFTEWNRFVANDLVIQSFILHTKVVIIGVGGNVTTRE